VIGDFSENRGKAGLPRLASVTNVNASNAKILIAQSDSEQADRLQQALLAGEPNLQLRLVDSASDVTRILSQERFDCLVCAAELPDAALPDLMDQIREVVGSLPVIALSDCPRQATAVECFRSGVTDFVSMDEALSGQTLCQRIDHALSRGRQVGAEKVRLERRQSELLSMAERDQLTGLFNRRYLDRRLRARTYQNDRRRRMSCIFLDVDLFKRVNDTFGHAVGDRVLQGVAKVLGERIGGGDAAIRWGGEEFVVLKSSADLTTAWNWAEDVRTEIGRQKFDSCGRTFSVTVSVGVSSFATREMAYDRIEEADLAMLLAKRKGRDRVCTSDMTAIDEIVKQVREAAIPPGPVRLMRFLQLVSDKLAPCQWRHVIEHPRRVEAIVLWLGQALSMGGGRLESLRQAALCHDLGKCFMPEAMLAQPGPLTRRQWRVMNRHAQLGAELAESLGLSARTVALIRAHHHGPGAPINASLEGGILAVADALAAMKAPRPYSRRLSSSDAIAELRRHAGSQFNPSVVQAVGSILEPASPQAA
jgi:diguanylate cyclase (GGDEF)-like protein/putative nucleotidyltransferase with HDIG domain